MKVLKCDKIPFLMSSVNHGMGAADLLQQFYRTPNAWGLNMSLLKIFPDYFTIRFNSSSGNTITTI